MGMDSKTNVKNKPTIQDLAPSIVQNTQTQLDKERLNERIRLTKQLVDEKLEYLEEELNLALEELISTNSLNEDLTQEEKQELLVAAREAFFKGDY